jgi:signal-transduction protein with cAMP-binding, CBS, and nucleotidyltransferase domain
MALITDALTKMKQNGFPRNKIFEIIRIIKTEPGSEQKNKIKAVLDKALSDIDNKDAVFNAIKMVIENNYHRWLMLADLWDYVGGEYA